MRNEVNAINTPLSTSSLRGPNAAVSPLSQSDWMGANDVVGGSSLACGVRRGWCGVVEGACDARE